MNTLLLPDVKSPPPDSDALYEVVKGQRVELTMSIYSVWIASRLHGRLEPFVESKGLGRSVAEALFILDEQEDERRRPDVAFVSAERWPLDRPLPEEGDWVVIPDLAVEVVSPTDRYEEVLTKIEEYFTYGVRQVWLVIPKLRQVYVYDSPTKARILTDADTLDSTLVEGFTLKLGELFQKRG